MSGPAGDGRRKHRIRGSMVPEAEFRSYYGRPIIKEPVWTWEVPWYFFVGGLASASASLGLGARLAGNHRLARSAWTVAAAGVTAGTPCSCPTWGGRNGSSTCCACSR